MSSMEDYSAEMEPGGRPMSKAWPHINRQKQAAVEAKYFEEGATVDFDRLPGPPAIARLFGSGQGPKRTLVIVSRVATVSRSAGRPLSQAEVDTLAEQAARAVGRLSWVMPLAVVGAGVVTWIDRKRFRFPFYTPPKNGWFDPRAFPTRRSPLVSGRNAGAVWHGLRFAAYLPLAWLGTGALFTSMTYTRLMADMADPRLEGLRRDIQQQQMAKGQNVRVPGMPRPANPANHENAEAWSEQYRTGEASSSSSSSAAPAWPEAPPASPATRHPSAPWPSQRSSTKEPQTPFDDTDLFDDDDDASPVPASVRRAERQQAAQQAQQRQQQEIQQQARQGQTAGSSWSRVRQQAGVSGSRPATANTATGDDAPPRSRTTSAWNRVRQGGAAGTTTTAAGDRPGGGEDYPYGESADDGAASRSQAQKQFDDMLEAERQGGSDGGRGGKRGW